jgi:hypothetical protein
MSEPLGIFPFHSGVSAIGVGSEMTVNRGSIANIEFNISALGTFTAQFEGQVYNKTKWYPIISWNLSTLASNIQTSDATATYQVPLEGWQKIRVNLTAINGTISVYGYAVA